MMRSQIFSFQTRTIVLGSYQFDTQFETFGNTIRRRQQIIIVMGYKGLKTAYFSEIYHFCRKLQLLDSNQGKYKKNCVANKLQKRSNLHRSRARSQNEVKSAESCQITRNLKVFIFLWNYKCQGVGFWQVHSGMTSERPSGASGLFQGESRVIKGRS